MKVLRKILLILALTIPLIALDQLTKIIAKTSLQAHVFINVLGEFFQITYIENRGAFLGMGDMLNEPLWTITMIILPIGALIAFWIYCIKENKLNLDFSIFLILLTAGGVGNLIDRIAYGKVADFMFIHVNDFIKSGIFNIADLYIVFLVIFMIFRYVQTLFVKKSNEVPPQA